MAKRDRPGSRAPTRITKQVGTLLARRPSWLDRSLHMFADVRPGEGLAAALLMVTLFAILGAYYVLKTVREGLILSGGMLGLRGDELKVYAAGAMALLMLAVVPAYGVLASRVERRRLLAVSYAVVIACLAVFFALDQAGAPIGLAFYIWLGIVNMFLVAQFWSFANDIYTDDEGKRLFAVVAIGGTAGAIAGPKLTGIAGMSGLMVLAAGMLVSALGLFWVIDALRRRGVAGHLRNVEVPEDRSGAPLGKDGGFQLVLRDRYLGLIALMLILANLVNTTGEYILSNAAANHAAAVVPDGSFAYLGTAKEAAAALAKARGEVIRAFYANFFFWVNLIGFLVQALLASRFIKYAGLRAGLYVLPAIALGGYGMIGLVGGLALLSTAKIAENSTDYSLQNTVRQALFLPTSREVKYKAKAAIDMFFVRFGDTAAALLVLVGIHELGLGARQFALVNVGVVAAWLAVALAIARRHRKLERRDAPGSSGASVVTSD